MKADTIQDVDIKRLLLKLESAFLTHQEVEELVDKVKRLENQSLFTTDKTKLYATEEDKK